MADIVYDVCVIGAGIIGSCAAYNAIQHTKSVVLCEQTVCSATIGIFSQFPLGHSRGSSHGHSRIIRNSYVIDHYAKMMPEAYSLWKQIEMENGGEKIVQNTGLLTLEDAPYTNIMKMKKSLEALNITYEYLDNVALKRKFPMLQHPNPHQAIFEPTGGLLQADKCISTVQMRLVSVVNEPTRIFKESGGVVKERFKVVEIRPGDIATVIGNISQIKAKSVILTAGPWTNDLLKSFGLALPLQTMKINVCYWEADSALYSLDAGFPCFIEYTAKEGKNWHLYGLPNHEYPNLLKVCAHYGEIVHPDHRDEEKSSGEIEVVADYLKTCFKGVAERPSIIEKCFYTWTPDEDFVLDYLPTHKNIVIGAGFSGHGFKLAPVSGKILAQLALGLQPNYDISPLRISRFNSLKSNL